MKSNTTPAAPPVHDRPARFIVAAGWLMIAAAGAIEAYGQRDSMNPDGVSYLDIGDAWLRGDWDAAISTYWNPLYPLIVSSSAALLRNVASTENAAIQVAHWLILLACFGTFNFMLRELDLWRRGEAPTVHDDLILPRWALYAIGYLAFAQCSLLQIQMFVSPDLMLSGVTYLAMGFVYRFARCDAGLLAYAVFGVVLGVGYLIKAIYVPLGVVFLAASLLLAARFGRAGIIRWAPAAIAFAIICGALIAAISFKADRLTYSDAGRINYVWNVMRMDIGHSLFRYHTADLLVENPPTYVYPVDAPVTFPLWYDPPAWFRATDADRFTWWSQIRAIYRGIAEDARIFAALGGPLVLVLVCAFAHRWPSRRFVYQWLATMLPIAAGLGAYALIISLPRYVAAFLTCLLVCSTAWIGGRHTPDRAQALRRGLACVLIVCGLMVLYPLQHRARAYLRQRNEPMWIGSVADGLIGLGVKPRDRVCIVGHALHWPQSSQQHWARRANVQIAAHVELQDRQFWDCTPGERAVVYERLREAGFTAIVCLNAPPRTIIETEAWKQLGATDSHCRMLR